MRLFGKYIQDLEVMVADFLPDGKQLYIVVADAECNIHILQFDPERTSPRYCLPIIHINNLTRPKIPFRPTTFTSEHLPPRAFHLISHHHPTHSYILRAQRSSSNG